MTFIILAKKFAEVQQKLGKDKSGQKPKEGKNIDKKKKEQKPKETKQSQSKEPEPEELPDETELALAQEPKSKDPFAAFPKGLVIFINLLIQESNLPGV